MTYPNPPWNLQGFAFQTLHLLDIDRVQSLVPSELEIISVFPKKTVGGVYIASYGMGSVLKYNELIVVSAIVRHGSRIGAWVSNIYVDNPDSVAGGRHIWGLPKELAHFAWDLGDQPAVEVRQGDRPLCNLRSHWQLPGIRQSIAVPAFSIRDRRLMQFHGQATLNLHVMGATLEVPSESPFAWLGFGNSWLSFYGESMNLVVDEPTLLRERETSFSYS